jgi:hypothetical protein
MSTVDLDVGLFTADDTRIYDAPHELPLTDIAYERRRVTFNVTETGNLENAAAVEWPGLHVGTRVTHFAIWLPDTEYRLQAGRVAPPLEVFKTTVVTFYRGTFRFRGADFV